MKRRDFLKFIGLSYVSFLSNSCGLKKSSEKLIPFLIPPEEDHIPGEPIYKTTVCKECPANCAIEAKLYDKVYKGKRNFFPVKFEGLSKYPYTQGSLCLRGQSSIERTYSPYRLKIPMVKRGQNFEKIKWEEIYKLIFENIDRGNNYIISGKIMGTGGNLIKSFCKEFGFKDIYFEFLSHSSIRRANEITFEIRDIPFYNLDKTEFLLSFGADILGSFLNPVIFAKYFSEKKFEWFHLEPHISITGMNCDKRFNINPETEILLVSYILKSLLLKKKSKDYDLLIDKLKKYDLKTVSLKTGLTEKEIKDIEYKALNKKTLLIAGDVSSMSEYGFYLNILINIFNYEKGNYNEIIDFSNSYGYEGLYYPSEVNNILREASEKENSVLFVNNLDLFKFFDKELIIRFLSSFKLKILFTDFKNKNLEYFDIVVPLSTFLEFKGDAQPFKNVYTLQNKLIERLYDTKSFEEFIFELMKTKGNKSHASYEEYIEKKWEEIFGKRKKDFINKGYIILNREVKVKFYKNKCIKELENYSFQNKEKERVLIITPSLRFFDGRSKDLVLLNEIPDPLSSISWGKFIYVPEEFAVKEGLKNGDEIKIEFEEDNEITLPIFITKLLNKRCFVVDVSFFNTGLKISETSKDFVVYKKIKNIIRTGKNIPLPILSGSFDDKNRIFKKGDDKEHEEIKHKVNHIKSIYPKHRHEKYLWAMVIDLDRCIGCSACVSACYIENNIPCTGYEEHIKGREMSWIRIEPYFENSKLEFVPMLCQQCHNAPCEPVCPVSATFHNSEGLNVQVYNRCVGTRYCSNNCPYKVRRFNWFDFSKKVGAMVYWTEERKLMSNPEVSIRSKGIMEKCSFCIQRIRRVKDKAKDEKREIKDGEIVPACMQTCPTKAITFGNIKNENSVVYKKSKTAFRVLEELGVEPSIYYVKKKNEKGK